jgi:hydrogenase nickel incorporation protein HypA/HybF
MHEIGIVQSTLNLAERHARDSGAGRIGGIRLRVGRMTGVVAEALEHAFAVLREGTMAREATLEVEWVAGVCWCLTCRAEFAAEGMLGECPRCGSPSPDVRAGMEMELVSLEVT